MREEGREEEREEERKGLCSAEVWSLSASIHSKVACPRALISLATHPLLRALCICA